MKKIFFGLLVGFLCFSCLGLEEITKDGFTSNFTSQRAQHLREYTAIGEGESLMHSIHNAKIAAMQKGVIDLIGLYNEQTNQQKLKYNLYNTENPNKWVVNSSMILLERSTTSTVYICKIKIPVKINELSDSLKMLGILSEPINLQQAIAEKNKTKDAQVILNPAKSNTTDNENTQFLEKYIENMTYMVFQSENSQTDRFLLKSGTQIANGYLLKQGYRAIDSEQVEKLKQEHTIVYDQSSTDKVSKIHLIAQRLNADIYIELDAETEGGSLYDHNKIGYYALAKISLKIFNPSTGELLGSVPYSSQKTFSKTSIYDAQANAIQSTIYKALPIAIDQAKIMLSKAYKNGIRYEIIINDTPDSKTMSIFRKQLKQNISALKTLYQSQSQTKYEVFFFGNIDDLEGIIYDVCDRVIGFENLELVMLRGKTLTFSSGF